MNLQNFQQKEWYIINDHSNTRCGRGNENDAAIKSETKVIKPNLCDYSNAYILVKVADVAANTNAAFKNYAPFTRCVNKSFRRRN